jgi:hypothetical protein
VFEVGVYQPGRQIQCDIWNLTIGTLENLGGVGGDSEKWLKYIIFIYQIPFALFPHELCE